MKSEALITVGSVGSLVAAVIVLARSFGLDISDEQQNAVLGFVAVVGPFVVALVGRQFVYAESTTQLLVNEAAVTGDTDIGSPPKGK